MRLNFYFLIFAITDVIAFGIVNRNFAHQDDFTFSLFIRFLYIAFFVFAPGNTLMWFQDLFRNKFYILIGTYLLGYLLLILLIGSFSNKPGNIIMRIIDLHVIPGSLLRLLVPYMVSAVVSMGLYGVFKGYRVRAAM